MPVTYVSTTQVGARLLRYTVKPKPGQTEAERVLHLAGQNCRPENAEYEFQRTRWRHGTQGATRKTAARYELPEPGETAAYVRDTRPNGRRYWRPARDDEAATHVRHEGEVVRQAEARHLITSFGLDEVNPDDPEQVAQAFAFVRARHAALFPGEQAIFVGQAEGNGGKFHVHTVRNATLYADMEIDGKLYKAGSKLAGDLTDIDRIRERADAFLADHGAEYGLGPQRLASVEDQKKERRNSRDRSMAKQGEMSNHDVIRAAFEESMDDPRAVDLDAFVEVMAERDVEVKQGLRRGQGTLSYWILDMGTHNTGAKKYVRGATLGDHFAFDSAVEQLAANAAGQPRERRPEPVQAGPARPVHEPTDEELAEARETMRALAAIEHEDKITDVLDACYWPALIVNDCLAEEAMAERNPGMMVLLAKEFNDQLEADRSARREAAKPKAAAPRPEPVTTPAPDPAPAPAPTPSLVLDEDAITAEVEAKMAEKAEQARQAAEAERQAAAQALAEPEEPVDPAPRRTSFAELRRRDEQKHSATEPAAVAEEPSVVADEPVRTVPAGNDVHREAARRERERKDRLRKALLEDDGPNVGGDGFHLGEE